MTEIDIKLINNVNLYPVKNRWGKNVKPEDYPKAFGRLYSIVPVETTHRANQIFISEDGNFVLMNFGSRKE